MRYLSVCSGIEAATSAWEPLGWSPAAFSEIEPFPRAVLAHHYPGVPIHGDFTTIGADEYGPIDLLVGGTPCQSFSIAGLRNGLGDERGNLALEFLRLADRKGPRWVVWENVPGVLSVDGGRALGAFLGGLAELGYGWAYRVLDSQYFGIPQRRRRVFVVGYRGEARRAAAVLFERACLSGDPTPLREASPDDPAFLAGRHDGDHFTPERDFYSGLVAGTLMSSGAGMERPAGMGSETSFLVPVPIEEARGAARMRRLSARTGGLVSGAVRRFTPVECERLQGFKDGYTDVPFRGKPASDNRRYRALGNSMCVDVMRWLGRRIALVDGIGRPDAANIAAAPQRLVASGR